MLFSFGRMRHDLRKLCEMQLLFFCHDHLVKIFKVRAWT